MWQRFSHGGRPGLGRLLGTRNLIVGVALFRIPDLMLLAVRLASDLHDAIRLRKRRTMVALGTAAIAMW